MTDPTLTPLNPALDLQFERVVDVPREALWAGWTQPALIKQWFTPAPWVTEDCEIDLRPGGVFRTVMRSPEGNRYPNEGCYLEIIENERLVWTNALGPGFRPCALAATDLPCASFAFTAIVSLAALGNGTRYTARVIHADEAGRNSHEALGFHEGWGKALDQLLALIKVS